MEENLLSEFTISPEALDKIVYNVLLIMKKEFGTLTAKTKIKHCYEERYVVHVKFHMKPMDKEIAHLLMGLGPYLYTHFSQTNESDGKLLLRLLLSNKLKEVPFTKVAETNNMDIFIQN